MVLPEAFVSKMKGLLREEFDDYLKSFDSGRHYGLRVNTLKVPAEKFSCLQPVPWCKSGFYYQEGSRPAKSPFYHAGLYYIQEPSAMAPAALLGVKPGDRVLDLCAAPGGKSVQLAARLQGKGLLISNDASAGRCKALVKNIENMGVTNAIVLNSEPHLLAKALPGFFDAVLVDAPCSGEGMFRKDPAAAKIWTEKRGEQFSKLQKEILAQAAAMVRPGGEIMYSTCTFSPEENEIVIKDFLDRHEEFELLPIELDAYGFDGGRPEWAFGDERLRGCARLWPHRIKGEGHFLARLKNKESENNREDICKPSEMRQEKLFEDFHAFCGENLNSTLPNFFSRHKSSLYFAPESLDLEGIRIIRAGWYLGEFKTKRFEPSQAFALGLTKEDAKATVDFQIDDSRVVRYLKGESLEDESWQNGWNLVCVDGFPLGWGKVSQGRLKNKYLPSWRME